ncbi:MAG: DUF1841 family protein [Pseudomonadota bacterium]
MLNHDRSAMRRQIAEAWARFKQGLPLDGLAAQIGRVVARHPEYHALVESPDAAEADFAPEDGQVNPFLHLSLHFAIDDQLKTNRPPGIVDVFRELCEATGDEHAAEHVLLERLGEALWQASRDQRPPDIEAYLRTLKADAARLASR